jgi:hypothetical protein
VTNVDAVELRDLKWAVVHVARSKDTRLLSILRAISMTKDRIDDRDPVEIADDFIDDVDRTLNPLGRFFIQVGVDLSYRHCRCGDPTWRR